MDYENETVRVEIPASLFAEYDMETDEIVRIFVVPKESDAGYFGPASEPIARVDGEDDEMTADMCGLDTQNVDGPFWSSMQRALQSETFVRITESGLEESDSVRTRVAIGWEE